MSQTQIDDRWLDVLAGKEEPQDADERQAASLRRFHELRDEHEHQLDPQALKRMENMIQARLKAADATAPSAPASASQQAAPGLLRQFSSWLFPVGGGHPGRFSAVAAVALAVVAAPLVWQNSDRDADDPASMKGGVTAPGAEAVIYSAQPEADVQAVLMLLAQQGVSAAVAVAGDDRTLEARVPPAQLLAVQQQLATLGVSLPADGQLKLRFKKAP